MKSKSDEICQSEYPWETVETVKVLQNLSYPGGSKLVVSSNTNDIISWDISWDITDITCKHPKPETGYQMLIMC